MLPFSEEQNLSFELTLQDKGYFSKVVAQISKDFNDVDFEQIVSKSNGLDLIQFYKLVENHLEFLMKQSEAGFFQKLYQIDMPELYVRDVGGDSGFRMYELAKQVVKRELLKVLLREQYN